MAVLAVACTTALGCAGGSKQRREPSAGETHLKVDNFIIKGTEAFTPSEIKYGLETQEWSKLRESFGWLPLIEREQPTFNYLAWKNDLDRIRTFYKRNGYFHTEITAENVVRHPEEGTVDLLIRIDEGEPVRIESVELEGTDVLRSEDRGGLLEKVPSKEGRIFTQERYVETKRTIVDRLKYRGYAYAEIQGRAVVRPDKRAAHIRYIVYPGPKAVFGEVEITGLKTVPRGPVERAIPFESGDPFSKRAVERAQKRLYKLDVFSLVDVHPVLEPGERTNRRDKQATEQKREFERSLAYQSDAERDRESKSLSPAGAAISRVDRATKRADQRASLDRRVPIEVELKEARNWDVRVGAGAAIESQRQDVHGIAEVTSKNFFGGLRTFKWENRLGYAWAPGLFSTDPRSTRKGDEPLKNKGVILRSEVELVQPWFARRRTNFRLAPWVERDVQTEFSYWNPGVRTSVDRGLSDSLTGELGYRISFYQFSNIAADFRASNTPLGRDFEKRFILEKFFQKLTLERRDSPLNPTSGFYGEFSIAEAVELLGEFDYLKSSTRIETYLPVDTFTKIVLATRLNAGGLLDIGRDAQIGRGTGIPAVERFKAGGRNSMRAFSSGNLTLFGEGGARIGGLVEYGASVEPRIRLVEKLFGVGDLWTAVFFDAGNVGTYDQMTEQPQLGTGTSLWMITPIGPLRIDVAYKLTPVWQGEDWRFDDRGFSRLNFIVGIGHSL